MITGPSGFQLMKAKNIDPKAQRLYGPTGLFGGIFDADIDIGIKKHAPESAQWKKWYEKITIQNLLDHRAGFTRSGDVAGAAKMFGVSEDDLTYEQVHRHFLRTRELLYEPCTTPPAGLDPYSNHGFGLWTLLIEKMSGKSYPDYVREDYLKPMKLHNAVRPERANPDSCDAHKHLFNENGKLEVLSFKESGLGLAAGGFMSSAQDLVRLMALLEKKYTVAELNSMGWGSTSKDKLSHSGKTADGLAFAAMFPKGYISNSGADLSRGPRRRLDKRWSGRAVIWGVLQTRLFSEAVPGSNVPATFDLWKQGKSVCLREYARRGVPANEYQRVFDEAAESGYRLEWIDGYTDDGKAHFNVIFRTNEPDIV